MRKQTEPNIKAHLLRGAFYLLVLVAVCVIPFALGQRTTTKQSAVAAPLLLGSAPVSPLSVSDAPFTFENTGSLHTARESHTATLLANGKVLVAGGEGGSGSLTSTELYDPASGSWPDPTPNPLTIGRAFHTATLLPNGKVLVAGGFNSGHLSSAELYDPASGSWAMTGDLIIGRADHTATLLLPTARCWWQGERIPWAILGPARNCTTRSAGAGL